MPRPRPITADPRRHLPSVERVLQEARVRDLVRRFGRRAVVKLLRRLVDEAREAARKGVEAHLDRIIEGLTRRLESEEAPSLVPLINATGVVIHTNLGRAPLSEAAASQVARVATSYSNLEFDLEAGERGDREAHAEARLVELLGAEATLVVNNNAAAVLLSVNTFAEGQEVLVSRGELVEIGGSFRIPDILRKSGARLREVGTTNRTRLSDFSDALSPETAMILKVHPSNFKMVGFTESVARGELVSLARKAGIPFVEDLGSGLVAPLLGHPRGEPTIAESLRAGVDIVTFSGDKLLGGPQAGLVAGDAARVGALRQNPLYRALRVDKMTLAALQQVLVDHGSGLATERIPVLKMLSLSREQIRERAEAVARNLVARLPTLRTEVVDGASAVGGGAAPTLEIPTALLLIDHPGAGPDQVVAALRRGHPPVVARVTEGKAALDLRTVPGEEDETLQDVVFEALVQFPPTPPRTTA